jgi:cytochrome c5
VQWKVQLTVQLTVVKVDYSAQILKKWKDMNTRLSRILIIMSIAGLLNACSSIASQDSQFEGQFRPPVVAGSVADAEMMAKWSRSCALCHITGEAGAPVVGDSSDWQQRLAKGEEAVLDNVIKGFNSMPPLGYCMACEVSDFRAMVAYMAGVDR